MVPSNNFVQIWAEEGRVAELPRDQTSRTSPTSPPNGWMSISIPAAAILCRGHGGRPASSSTSAVYDGNPNTAEIFLDPPEELRGRVNVIPPR